MGVVSVVIYGIKKSRQVSIAYNHPPPPTFFSALPLTTIEYYAVNREVLRDKVLGPEGLAVSA